MASGFFVFMWQQEPEKPPIMNTYPSFLLWSPRGKLTKISGQNEAKNLLAGRWRKPTDEELERYKPGDYCPIYDYGENIKEDVIQGSTISTKAVGELLECVEL